MLGDDKFIFINLWFLDNKGYSITKEKFKTINRMHIGKFYDYVKNKVGALDATVVISDINIEKTRL